MFSVTQRIESVNQPKGGYVNTSLFEVTYYNDDNVIYEVHEKFSSIIGMAVDYLTRMMIGNKKERAFNISLEGAKNVGELENAEDLLESINGIDDESVFNACRLVGYDVAFRKGEEYFRTVESICPDENVIHNIQVMVKRSIEFIQKSGPVILDGFNFVRGYTDLVSSGDGDYLTKDTLWDFKTSKREINTKQTLQLLMYYIMGVHSINVEFEDIKKIGIFNPRKNKSYVAKLSEIDSKNFYEVSSSVLGYEMATKDYAMWRCIKGSNKDIVNKYIIENFLQNTGFDPKNFSDGIYDITTDDYWSYLKRKTISIKKPEFKNIKAIKFLKNSGYIMFICVLKREELGLMYGSRYRKLKGTVEWYYENLPEYATRVLNKFSKYWDGLYIVSEHLKKIKPDKEIVRMTRYAKYVDSCVYVGTEAKDFDGFYEEQEKEILFRGNVHGCIIDLDFNNHIYINPYDGRVIPYTAFSKYERVEYENIASLIKASRPEMLPYFENVVEKNKNSILVAKENTDWAVLKDDEINEEEKSVFSNCDMYGISDKLKTLQLIYDEKLVEIWHDEILPVPEKTKKKKQTVAKKVTCKVGASNKMKCGMVATVIEDKGYRNITVQFEDGTIVYETTREKFINGKIHNMNRFK